MPKRIDLSFCADPRSPPELESGSYITSEIDQDTAVDPRSAHAPEIRALTLETTPQNLANLVICQHTVLDMVKAVETLIGHELYASNNRHQLAGRSFLNKLKNH